MTPSKAGATIEGAVKVYFGTAAVHPLILVVAAASAAAPAAPAAPAAVSAAAEAAAAAAALASAFSRGSTHVVVCSFGLRETK